MSLVYGVYSSWHRGFGCVPYGLKLTLAPLCSELLDVGTDRSDLLVDGPDGPGLLPDQLLFLLHDPPIDRVVLRNQGVDDLEFVREPRLVSVLEALGDNLGHVQVITLAPKAKVLRDDRRN